MPNPSIALEASGVAKTPIFVSTCCTGPIMAKRKTFGAKSAFVRKVFGKKPSASVAEVIGAWKSAGNKGTMSPTLVYQRKSKLGGGYGKKRGRPRAGTKARKVVARRRQTTAGRNGYLAIEQVLDGQAGQVEALGDRALAKDLRQARRNVSARLV